MKLKPREIYDHLTKTVVSNDDAKRTLAIAIRNQWRRSTMPPEIVRNVRTNNILMTGNTGTGKTQLVKSLAELIRAPLAIASATEFTQVGYIGKDVSTIIFNLLRAGEELYNFSASYQNSAKCKHGMNYVQNLGIIFIDEIDKIASTSGRSDNVGRTGVQRDLLPLLDGTLIDVGSATIDTSNILFICAGAFHESKVTDLMPEFLGRVPIRTSTIPHTSDSIASILKLKDVSPLAQCIELLKVDGCDVTIDDSAYPAIADIAMSLNLDGMDMGARRLYHMTDILFKDLMFDPPSKKVIIDSDYVHKKLKI